MVAAGLVERRRVAGYLRLTRAGADRRINEQASGRMDLPQSPKLSFGVDD